MSDGHGNGGRLRIVILAVADVQRAVRFYRAAFGWRVRAEVPVYVELEASPSTRVGIYLREGFAANTGALPERCPPGALTAAELYVDVDDLDAAAERLVAAGARLLSPAARRPWGDVAAYFADLDGNVVAIAREDESDAPYGA